MNTARCGFDSAWGGLPWSGIVPPTVVYSEALLRSNMAEFAARIGQCYRGGTAHFYYAVKACTLPQISRITLELGWGLEVQSLAEWDALGLPGAGGVYNGPGKTRDDLTRGMAAGLVVIADGTQETQDLWQLAQAGRMAPGAAYGLRIQVRSLTPFGELGNKLGMDQEDALRLLATAREQGLPMPRWLHFHCLARCASPAAWSTAARQALDFMDRARALCGHEFQVLDLGGGVETLTALRAQGTSFADMADQLARTLEQGPYPFDIAFEPGRAVVGDAALGLCRVVRTKTVGGRRWAMVDLATNLLIPLPRARFSVVTLQADTGAPTESWNIGDGTCSPAGVLARDADLPATLAPGDMLAVLGCGAYTYSLSEHFYTAPPVPVLWRVDGSLTVMDMPPAYPTHSPLGT